MKRYCLSLDPGTLAHLSHLCHVTGESRSAVIRALVSQAGVEHITTRALRLGAATGEVATHFSDERKEDDGQN